MDSIDPQVTGWRLVHHRGMVQAPPRVNKLLAQAPRANDVCEDSCCPDLTVPRSGPTPF